jgi:hypothetical protein
MSDFLARLAERAVGAADRERLLPAAPFRFAPGEPGLAPSASEARDRGLFDAAMDAEQTGPSAVHRTPLSPAADASDDRGSLASPFRADRAGQSPDAALSARGRSSESAGDARTSDTRSAAAASPSAPAVRPFPSSQSQNGDFLFAAPAPESPTAGLHPSAESSAFEARALRAVESPRESARREAPDEHASDAPVARASAPRVVPAIQPGAEHAVQSMDERDWEPSHQQTRGDASSSTIHPAGRAMDAEGAMRPVAEPRVKGSTATSSIASLRAMRATPVTRPRLEPVAHVAAKESASSASARGDGEAQAPAAAPAIHVSIGRVEVRAVSAPAAGTRARPASASTPAVSLDDYLRSRDGGRR